MPFWNRNGRSWPECRPSTRTGAAEVGELSHISREVTGDVVIRATMKLGGGLMFRFDERALNG